MVLLTLVSPQVTKQSDPGAADLSATRASYTARCRSRWIYRRGRCRKLAASPGLLSLPDAISLKAFYTNVHGPPPLSTVVRSGFPVVSVKSTLAKIALQNVLVSQQWSADASLSLLQL